ncbi:MAG: internal scaffolding protein [Arizlama microvirus]|nr:MAG: internal scaffolding protein [Arizlama microvirus]
MTINKPIFATRFSTKLRKGLKNLEPSKTKQSFADECDINNVLKRYASTGQLPSIAKSNPRYGDFSSPSDYQNSLNTVLYANEQFSSLPSSVRSKFQNDPIEFLQFAQNPENGAELVKLGLAEHKLAPDNKQPQKPAKKAEKPDV